MSCSNSSLALLVNSLNCGPLISNTGFTEPINDNVIPVLTSLHKNNYEIIIFTNQAGFKKKESKKDFEM